MRTTVGLQSWSSVDPASGVLYIVTMQAGVGPPPFRQAQGPRACRGARRRAVFTMNCGLLPGQHSIGKGSADERRPYINSMCLAQIGPFPNAPSSRSKMPHRVSARASLYSTV